MTDVAPERVEHKNVAEALVAIMAEMPGIEKEFDPKGGVKFAYRHIEQITGEARDIFVKHGVVVTPCVLEMPVVTDRIVGGNPWTDTMMRVMYTFHHGASDTSIDAITVGIGRDNSDKGANKAMTQSLKYLLIPTLLISDPAEDGDGSVDAADSLPSGREDDVSIPWATNGYSSLEDYEKAHTAVSNLLDYFKDEAEYLESIKSWLAENGIKVKWPMPKDLCLVLVRTLLDRKAEIEAEKAQPVAATAEDPQRPFTEPPGRHRAPSATELERLGVTDADKEIARQVAESMTVAELADELKRLGLSPNGDKEELQFRYEAGYLKEFLEQRKQLEEAGGPDADDEYS